MDASAEGHKIDRQPDNERRSGSDQPAGGGGFRLCVVGVGGTLLGLATILTLSLNGGSLNLTPNSLALNVNPPR